MLLRNTTYVVPSRIAPRNATFLRLSTARRHNSHDSTFSQDAHDFTQFSHASTPRRQSPTKLLSQLSQKLPAFHQTLLGLNDSQVEVFNRTIQELVSLLLRPDLDKAWKLWSRLDDACLTTFLAPEHYDRFSRVISHVCNNWPPDKAWTVDQKKALETMSIKSALKGSTGGLKAYLVFWIKRKKPRTVLHVYSRFTEQFKIGHRWDDSQQDAGLESTADINPPAPFVNSGILLAAVTAHAMQNSFFDALRTTLETTTRFPAHSITEFAHDIKHDPGLLKKVKEYVRRLEIARLVARPRSLAKQLSNLSRDHAITNLEKLYKGIMEGFDEPLTWLTVKPDEVDSLGRVLFPGQIWATFILAFQRCQRADLVERVWSDMAKVGIRPNAPAWTALIDGYAEQKSAEGAISSWNSMLQAGVEPDLTTHRAIISALFSGDRPEAALIRFKDFQEEVAKSTYPPNDPLVVVVYNTTIHGLFLNYKEADAMAIVDKMHAEGPKPDVVTFNTILHHYGRKGDLKTFANILQQLDGSGLSGDVFTFSTVLSVLMKLRDDAPQIMLNLMAKQGVKPTTTTLSTIIDYQMKLGTAEGLKAALSLLEKMEHSGGDTRPNEVTYTAVLAGLHRATWLDRRVADDHCKAILERMHKRGIRPDKATYNILLKACLGNNSPEGVQNAMRYYGEIKQRKIVISNDTWYIILHGLLRRREWDLASEIARDHSKGGYKSSAAVEELIKRINRERHNRANTVPEYI